MPPKSAQPNTKNSQQSSPTIDQMTHKELLSWRQALSLSQSRAGEMLGISRVSYGKLERGDAAIDVRTELACRWLLAMANWQVDAAERRSWMRALGRWTT